MSGLYNTGNVFEKLNAGVYAPLVGTAKPMVEAVKNITPSLEAGQGIAVTSAGVATLSTDNATHVVVGSNLGLVDGTFTVAGGLERIQAVPLGLALVDCQVLATETIVVGDLVAFASGKLIEATTETQTFTVLEIETVVEQGTTIQTARIKFEV